MGEPGVLRAYLPSHGNGFGKAEMGVMRVITDSVECQMFEAFQLGELLLWDAAHVGDVGDVAETEAQYGHLAMVAADGDYLHSAGGDDVPGGNLRRRHDVVSAGNDRAVGHLHAVAFLAHPDEVSSFDGCDCEGFFVDDVNAPFR